jgi:hypothetical protein
MKYFPLIILTQLIHTEGWTQSAGKQDGIHTQVASEQRRAELRLILGAPHGRETNAPEVASVDKSTPAIRHLSAQERKNLRLQLQVQRDNVRSD